MSGSKLRSSIVALGVSASLLAGCGHGSSGSAVLPSNGNGSNQSAQYAGSATATFTFTFPKPTSAQLRAALGTRAGASARAPRYLSSATKSISLQVTDTKNSGSNADIYANVPAALKAVQSATFSNGLGQDGTVAGECGTDPQNAGNYQCTASFLLPIGINTLTIASWDGNGGTGNKLSQQIATVTTLQGVANAATKPPALPNAYNVSLDANAATITLSGSQPCQNGPVGSVFGSVGTTPVNFGVSFADAATKTIVNPGLPVISILGNDAAYHTDGGTINATGGTVGFTINQSAQSFTLTPSTVPISGASVTVKGTPASGSDGLSFNVSHNFTFSAGTAPPSHNFLAVVEQTGVGSGKVDFFNLTTDGGGPNGWATGGAVFTPASLAVTQSTNDNTQNDVDNPVSLAWDTNGDLLIGNGGSSGNGNMACVPVGAISTGANTSTTVTANVHDPVGLAYEPRNGTVAIGNNTNTGGAAPLAEYVLSGNYTASTTAGPTNLHSFNGSIGGDVVNMPSLATGTFAATLTDGCEVDSNHKSCGSTTGTSQVVLFNGSGVTTTMTDSSTYHIDEPWGITWDNTNSQLIIANNSAWHPSVVFYTTTGSFVKTDGHDYFGASQNPYLVAANGAGLFAVAYTTAIAGDEVQIYTNAAGGGAPVPLFNPIPFDAENNSSCSGGYVYGSSAIVSSITWLSNTRLLVGLETSLASANGYYIYDTASSTTPSQWDFGNGASCNAVGAIPAQKAFQQITNKPLAAAFKS